MGEWRSPPQLARERGIRVSKVLAWIRRGELEAVNLAENLLGRPRWRISRESIARFDKARSNRPSPSTSPTAIDASCGQAAPSEDSQSIPPTSLQRASSERRKTRAQDVIEFF